VAALPVNDDERKIGHMLASATISIMEVTADEQGADVHEAPRGWYEARNLANDYDKLADRAEVRAQHQPQSEKNYFGDRQQNPR
jgi:hypothetical protein